MSSNQIDQTLSLMIPRVFPQWIDEQKIIDVFHKQHLGRVYKVSIIRKPDSKKRSYPIYQAFVYFSAWYENEIAYHFQQRIFGEKAQARIVYDDPWYWVAFENTKRRLSNNDKRIMRAGYQTYVAEQYMLEQDERIQRLENFLQKLPLVPEKSEPHLMWPNLSEEFVMDTLGAELNLTETAIGVAEAALLDESAPLEPASLEPALLDMDISSNIISGGEWYQWTNPISNANNISNANPISNANNISNANPISNEWTECKAVPWQQMQLEFAASEMLGDELRLTETAIDVAEFALKEQPSNYDWSSKRFVF